MFERPSQLVGCPPSVSEVAFKRGFEDKLAWSSLVLSHFEPPNPFTSRNVTDLLMISGFKEEASFQQRFVADLFISCYVQAAKRLIMTQMS